MVRFPARQALPAGLKMLRPCPRAGARRHRL